MPLYFSVCRLSYLSELVKYCPHPSFLQWTQKHYEAFRLRTPAQYSWWERCSRGTGGRMKNGPRGNKQEVFLKIFFAHYSERFRDFSPLQQHFHQTNKKQSSMCQVLFFDFRLEENNDLKCNFVTSVSVWALLLHVTNIAGHASDKWHVTRVLRAASNSGHVEMKREWQKCTATTRGEIISRPRYVINL